MKKLIIILAVCLVLPMISATCTDDNNFILGQDINICSKGCLYQNESNLSEYLACDSSVTCLFSAFYENGTLIVSARTMQRDGVNYNYSLGNLTITGVYTGQIYCFRDKGFMPPLYFPFTISSQEIGQQLGLPRIQTGQVILDSAISEAEDRVLGKIKRVISKWWPVVLLAIILIILIVIDLRNGRIKKIAKGVSRINVKKK